MEQLTLDKLDIEIDRFLMRVEMYRNVRRCYIEMIQDQNHPLEDFKEEYADTKILKLGRKIQIERERITELIKLTSDNGEA